MKASVIVPVYNSARTVGRTLASLEAQSYRDFEIVAVDDGSTDSSPQIVAEFAGKSSVPVKVVRQPNSGAGKARNLGVRNASGAVVVFIDSDCIAPSNWLETLVAPLGEDMAGCTCGYRTMNKESLVARYIGYEIAWRHQRLVGRETNAFGSYSLSLLKSAFDKAGGFDTTYTAANAEDFDLAFRLDKLGCRILFSGDTFVYHFHPSSLQRYLRQQYTRGYWRVKMYLQNRDRILQGDSYTGREAQVQFVLSHVALISLPLAVMNPFSPLAGFGLLFLSNLPLGVWAFKQEKKFLVLAPALAGLRSLAGTFGAWDYVIKHLIRLPAKPQAL